MSEPSSIQRFEELEAGRLLGDLDRGEIREWEELSQALDARPDLGLELAAAAVEAEFLMDADSELPADFAPELRKEVMSRAPALQGPSEDDKIVRPGAWKRIFAARETAWAVAAILAILLVATFLAKPERPRSPELAMQALEQEAPDLLKLAFAGLGDYEALTGEVLWSDDRQEGYMVLSNIPVNDPSVNQYQLWIVDPARDEKPVDGGVFDIPQGKTTAVIPIDNPLAVSAPQAFVITLEQPGGVVVSKQEVVVALAKAS